MGSITHQGDAVKWARKRARKAGPSFHALFCDAPYEISFMGKDWDGSGVAFDPDTWEAFASLLYPGGFLFVFAGTINDDLISVAMREAGLRKFHKIMGWAYGSGFPKASRVDTQIDRRKGFKPGLDREISRYLREARNKKGLSNKDIARLFGFNSRMAAHWCAEETDSQPLIPRLEHWNRLKVLLDLDDRYDEAITEYEREIVGKGKSGIGKAFGDGEWGSETDRFDITAPATPLSQAFSGHRYGLQALKPAIETILIFQKPYEGRPIDDITQTGAGVLNIDGGRIGTETTRRHRLDIISESGWEGGFKKAYETGSDSGRWPSNLLLLDEGAARALDDQSGELKGGSGSTRGRSSNIYGGGNGFTEATGEKIGFDDSGGASRFFFRVSEQIDEADPVYYSAKASRGERDAGLEGFDLREAYTHNIEGGDRNKPSNALGGGERKRVERGDPGISPSRNPHPTVKPLSLCKYLATLLLPPPEYAPRRIFVPFAGVGSEQIGAVMAGWEEVEGVELKEEYIPINRARLEYWKKRPNGLKKPKSKIPENVKNSNQLELI